MLRSICLHFTSVADIAICLHNNLSIITPISIALFIWCIVYISLIFSNLLQFISLTFSLMQLNFTTLFLKHNAPVWKSTLTYDVVSIFCHFYNTQRLILKHLLGLMYSIWDILNNDNVFTGHVYNALSFIYKWTTQGSIHTFKHHYRHFVHSCENCHL